MAATYINIYNAPSRHLSNDIKYSDCVLTTELLHEANVSMGVERQCVGCDAQGVEKVGGSDALQSPYTLCTHRPHFLLRQTAVPQGQNVSQGHVLLRCTDTQHLTVWSSAALQVYPNGIHAKDEEMHKGQQFNQSKKQGGLFWEQNKVSI